MSQHEVFAANTMANATREASLQNIRYQEALRKQEDQRLEQCLKDFAEFDHRALHLKSDKELAAFQAAHLPASPQYALALNEWNRRLVTRQVKATQHAAWIGLVGVIVGALLGWFLSSYNSPNHPQKNQDSAGQESSQQHQRPNPDQVPPKPASQPPPK